MYIVKVGNTKIFDPRVDELALINPVVELEENSAGSFSFTMPPDHPHYDLIEKRKSVIAVYYGSELIFSGVAIETEVDFFKQKKVVCDGELSYLNDTVQRPARYQGITVRGLLEAYIDNHNAQVEDEKKFKVGIVTVRDLNDSIYCYSNMESTMTCLKEDLVDDLGGYFRIRHEGSIKYIDYLADSMYTNQQVICLGENLLDFKSNIDSTDIATAIIPLGERLEESPIEGLEVRLDIKSVNDGLDYVCSQEAIQNYGWIYKTVEWDNVTTAEALKRKGEQYLADIQFENMVIEAKAVDLHLVDGSEDRFKLSDQIRVLSKPHGLDRYFRLTKQTLHLNSPENDTVTLGKEERITLTAKANQTNEAIYKAIETITPPSTILRQAGDNATQLITNALGGYVVLNDTDGDGHPDEILIMDTADTSTATKVWRWNQNGLGYSNSGYNGQYGTAMTMDGSIVADFVSAGTMSGDRVKGGTFEVGGTGYGKDGSIVVKNSSNQVIFKADKNGITVIGYATDDDIADMATQDDISDMATNSGLSGGTTTINGGCIKTGNVVVGGNVENTNINGQIIVKNDKNQVIFKADKNGITISGYATDSDISNMATKSDISDMATNSGLSGGTTTINGGCITTGTISADRIKGGTLEVGGTGYGKDGSISVKNASDKVIVTVDKDGVKALGNDENKYVTVDNNGVTSYGVDNYANHKYFKLADSVISARTYDWEVQSNYAEGDISLINEGYNFESRIYDNGWKIKSSHNIFLEGTSVCLKVSDIHLWSSNQQEYVPGASGNFDVVTEVYYDELSQCYCQKYRNITVKNGIIIDIESEVSKPFPVR